MHLRLIPSSRLYSVNTMMMTSHYNSVAHWAIPVQRHRQINLKHLSSHDGLSVESIICSGIMLVPMGIWLGETIFERALLVGSIFIVMMVDKLIHRNAKAPASVFRQYTSARHETPLMLLALIGTGLLWLTIGVPKLLF